MTLWIGFKQQHSASDEKKIGPNEEERYYRSKLDLSNTCIVMHRKPQVNKNVI